MNYTFVLYITICLMFFTVLTNMTLLHNEWNGITLYICLGLFIFATAIFGMSRQRK